MPATPSSSHAYTPAPSSEELGIMPDLYRLSVGPINAAYYQKHFQRFETLGKAVPTWNNGAAFFTLAWLLMRKLWRPAAIYSAVVISLLLVWWFGIHGNVPLQVEAALCLFCVLLLCAVPGFLGNALYYQHVRNQTLETLGKASSLAQARVILTNDAPTKERYQVAISVQALAAAAIAAGVFSQLDLSSTPRPAIAPSGPPDIVIPSVESLRSQQPPALAPSEPLPELPTPEAPPAEAPPASPTTPPTVAPQAPAEQPAPAAEPTASKEDQLSIVEFAQSVPAAGGAAAVAAIKAVATPTQAAPTATAQAVPAKKAVAPAKAAPATPPASKTAPARANGNNLVPGKFYLNAGVYAQQANVNNAAKRLQSAKLNTLRQTVQTNKGELTRLRIGPFDTRKQAEQAALRAKQLRIETTIFQQPKS